MLFFCSADLQKTIYCDDVVLTQDNLQKFVFAVQNHYWYQMYIDDLPIWGKYLLNNILNHYFSSVNSGSLILSCRFFSSIQLGHFRPFQCVDRL